MSFNSDQPKTTKEQDALDFADSAESVAKSIFNSNFPEGFVLGVEGDWGSGKTTYINFILEYLKNNHPEFKILEFNPWLHSSHENLIAAYFKFLSTKANDIFDDDSQETLANIIDIFTPAAGSAINLVTGGVFGKSAEIAIELYNKKLKETPLLEKQYEDIKTTLKTAQKRFLVVIDDLDRLDNTEIKTMLKLVKSVGKLPYVTYILSYNRAYVENATNSEMPNFIEKIVQLPIPIPKPAQSKLITMLTDYALEEFFKNINRKEERWRYFVDLGLYYYIKNPREVYLLSNSINFRFSAMKGILNPIELFVLEVLRLFHTDLWNWIRDNKYAVIKYDAYFIIKEGEQPTKQELEKLLFLPATLSEKQKMMLISLFPHLSNSIEATPYNKRETIYESFKNKPLGTDLIERESVYDAYFAQYIEETEVSEADITRFVSNANNRIETAQALRILIEKRDGDGNSQIDEFLKLLSAYFEKLENPEPPQELLWALIDIYEELYIFKDARPNNAMMLDSRIRIIFKTLHKRIGKQKTFIFLKDLCNDKNSVSATIPMLSNVGIDIDRFLNFNNIPRLGLIDVSNWGTLTEIFAPHLKNAFLKGDVDNFPYVGYAEFMAIHIFNDLSTSTTFPELPKYIIKYLKSRSQKYRSKYETQRNRNFPNLFDHDILAKYVANIDLTNQDQISKEVITDFLKHWESSYHNRFPNKNPTDFLTKNSTN